MEQINLTDEQKEVLLKVGSTENLVTAPMEIIKQFLDMGILYKRKDKHLDLTDLGEKIYDELSNAKR